VSCLHYSWLGGSAMYRTVKILPSQQEAQADCSASQSIGEQAERGCSTPRSMCPASFLSAMSSREWTSHQPLCRAQQIVPTPPRSRHGEDNLQLTIAIKQATTSGPVMCVNYG
jgi:hypothetical protein